MKLRKPIWREFVCARLTGRPGLYELEVIILAELEGRCFVDGIRTVRWLSRVVTSGKRFWSQVNLCEIIRSVDEWRVELHQGFSRDRYSLAASRPVWIFCRRKGTAICIDNCSFELIFPSTFFTRPAPCTCQRQSAYHPPLRTGLGIFHTSNSTGTAKYPTPSSSAIPSPPSIPRRCT